LNGAELRAFDLPRDRTQLARRVNLGFDTTARIPLDRCSVVSREEMARIVYRWQRYFHHVSFVLGLCRTERKRPDRHRGNGGIPEETLF
jgi:hypothetical protein